MGGPLSMMAVCVSLHFVCKYLVKTGSRHSYDLDKGWRLEGREGNEPNTWRNTDSGHFVGYFCDGIY